jgi:hypothetical protein
MENGDLLFKSLFVGGDYFYFTNDIDKMRPCLSGALSRTTSPQLTRECRRASPRCK